MAKDMAKDMTMDFGSPELTALGENMLIAPVRPNSVQELPAGKHPALVDLASVAPGTRASVRSGLQVVAEIMFGGKCNLHTMPWAALRAQHTLALRAELASRYAHGTANKMLAYVKGVLRAAWQLDLLIPKPCDGYLHHPHVKTPNKNCG